VNFRREALRAVSFESDFLWQPRDCEAHLLAHLLAQLLRGSRLMVLYGETGAGKTTLVKGGVLPLLRRRVGDRVFARGNEPPVMLPFPDRRGRDRTGGHGAEVAIFFDAWDKTPLTALYARILNALPVGHGRKVPPFSNLAECLAAWSKELDARFLIVFDRFEEYLAAPMSLPGIRRFANDFAQVINEPLLPANFLLLLPDEQALFGRFGKRILSLGDDRLCLPRLHCSTAIPPDAAQAAEVYGSVAAVARPLARVRIGNPGRSDQAAARILAEVPPTERVPSLPAAQISHKESSGAAHPLVVRRSPDDISRAERMPGEYVQPSELGTPQGGPLSPRLANILLDDRDGKLEKHGHHFARYADDLLILVKSVRAGQRLKARLTAYLGRRLHLPINEAKNRVTPIEECVFLGFTFRGGKPRWSDTALADFKHRARHLTGRSWGVSILTPILKWLAIPVACVSLLLTAWTTFELSPDPRSAPVLQAAGSDQSVAAVVTATPGTPDVASGLPNIGLVTDIASSTDVRIARDLARFIAPEAGVELLVQADTFSGAAPLLAIIRYDVLKAARTGEAAAREAMDGWRTVTPLYTDEIYFIVRVDSPLAFIHDIREAKINLGPSKSSRGRTVALLYEQMFGASIPAANVSFFTDEQALIKLVGDRTIDAMALIAAQPAKWLVDLPPQMRQSIRLLKLDPEHPASRRAIQRYLPATIRVASYDAWLREDTLTLAVMSFLVTSDYTDQAAIERLEMFTRSLCRNLPVLRREGHPKWREVQPDLKLDASLHYSAPAEAAFHSCSADNRAGNSVASRR